MEHCEYVARKAIRDKRISVARDHHVTQCVLRRILGLVTFQKFSRIQVKLQQRRLSFVAFLVVNLRLHVRGSRPQELAARVRPYSKHSPERRCRLPGYKVCTLPRHFAAKNLPLPHTADEKMLAARIVSDVLRDQVWSTQPKHGLRLT